MKHFISTPLISCLSCETLYDRISSFDNLRELMPEQIINWQSGDDACTFEIKGMTRLSLKYAERVPLRKVRIEAVNPPFPIELSVELTEGVDQGIICCTLLKADLNPMLAMLASRPLQHLVDTINRKLVSE